MTDGNYFHFQGKFVSQNHGAPMGSVLSPVLAELFTENIEEKAFSPTALLFAIKAFRRYTWMTSSLLSGKAANRRSSTTSIASLSEDDLLHH
ncbi:hypothetical protein M514_07273 [Trichuris suis]|uniref:Reverse transcriptase domain-containing protein n=1 Tax=Trichuris suis TaxID=68888 RepID=A0A085N1J8_9BILA|nr:hypothetical protein M513_07273 [Trichuris suis]KFD63344.1 hypothetical protein M514_07273 [Trichuris suis]